MRDHSMRHLWTTFSDDQIDLNYRSPEVLLAMVDVLLCYLEKGAEYVRLDAVGFMWKEPGTNCIHLEKTHLIIKLLRSIIDNVAPGTVIITGPMFRIKTTLLTLAKAMTKRIWCTSSRCRRWCCMRCKNRTLRHFVRGRKT